MYIIHFHLSTSICIKYLARHGGVLGVAGGGEHVLLYVF